LLEVEFFLIFRYYYFNYINYLFNLWHNKHQFNKPQNQKAKKREENKKEVSVEEPEIRRKDHQEIERKTKETNGNQSPNLEDLSKPDSFKTSLISSDSQSQSKNQKLLINS